MLQIKKIIIVGFAIGMGLLMASCATDHPHHKQIVVVPPPPRVVHKKYSATMYSGSLRKNIERIIARSHWAQRVIWNVKDSSTGNPIDFNWVGKTRVTSFSLQGVIGKILADYPVQAVFYKGNRVVVLQPRVIG